MSESETNPSSPTSSFMLFLVANFQNVSLKSCPESFKRHFHLKFKLQISSSQREQISPKMSSPRSSERSPSTLSMCESHLIWSSGFAVEKLIPVVDTLTGPRSHSLKRIRKRRERQQRAFLFVLLLNNTAQMTASKQKHWCSEERYWGLDVTQRNA